MRSKQTKNEPSDPRLRRLKRALDARNAAFDRVKDAREALLNAEADFVFRTRQLFLIAAKLEPVLGDDRRLNVILQATISNLRRQEL